MQTALHILALTNELKSEIIDGKIVGSEYYRKERAVYFIIKKKQRLALGFAYHPVKWGTYLIPASKIKVDTREKPRPVFDMEGAVITTVGQLGLDRFLVLTLKHGSRTSSLVFEALGPNGNIWLLDSQKRKLGSMRKKAFTKGEPYDIQPLQGKLNPIDLTPAQFVDALKAGPEMSLVQFIEKNVIGLSYALARETAYRAGLDQTDTGELDEAKASALIKSLRQVIGSFESPSAGYVYDFAGRHEAYPLKLSFVDKQPTKHKTLSLAVFEAAQSRSTAADERDDEKTVLSAVKRAVKKLEKRLINVDKDITEAADYETYRRLGDLLKINYQKIKKGMTSIEVEDVYSDTHGKIKIELDTALAPNENAEVYFKRHRKGREGLALLKRRLQITRQELAEMKEILAELEKNFETACQKYEQEILSLLPAQVEGTQVAPRLPYRPFTLSTGLRIYVGRDGADNDRTTFEFARPYELWFHTQQCAGSHVVMKFPNKSFEPSKREIEETAAVAAWYSKARNDSLVPVIYTQRKYVRKPRKAKPGLVLVEREKSVMVEPAKPAEE